MWLWWLFLLLLVVLTVVWVCIVLTGAKRVGECCLRMGPTVNVGVNPAGLAVTPCGNRAYVANNNNYGLTGSDSVTVVDLCKAQVVTTIEDSSFSEPYTVSIFGCKAYVTNSASTTVSVIDLKTNTVTAVIAGFDGPSGFSIVKKSKIAYVNNYGSAAGVGSGNGTTVVIVDLLTDAIIGSPITVGQAPAALANDGKFVYVINYENGNPGTGTMSIIDISTNLVTQTITGFSGPFGLALKPKWGRVYVTNFGSNNFWPYGTTVSIVDVKTTFSIVHTIENVGIQPSGIVLKDDMAYVTTYNTLYASPDTFENLTAGQGQVVAIDLKRNKIVQSVLVGQSPDAIVKHNDTLLVTNYTSNTLSTLSI